MVADLKLWFQHFVLKTFSALRPSRSFLFRAVCLFLPRNGTYFRQNVGRNEFYELRQRPTFNVMPLPELAALGPAYGAWPHD